MLAEPPPTLPRKQNALSSTPVPPQASQDDKYFQTWKPCKYLAIWPTEVNCDSFHFQIKVFEEWEFLEHSTETVESNSKKKTGINFITSVRTISELEAVLWECHPSAVTFIQWQAVLGLS